MNVNLGVLMVYVVLIILSLARVLPISWIGVLVAYLATDRAVTVFRSSR